MPIVPTLSIIGTNLVWPAGVCGHSLIDNNRVSHEVRAHNTPMRINNSAIAYSFRMSVPEPLLHYTLGSVFCSDTAISDDCIPYSIATPIVHSFLHTNHCTIISVSHGSIGYSDGSTGYISITPLASVVGLRNLHHCGLWLHLQQ